jgi:hypothetical protein
MPSFYIDDHGELWPEHSPSLLANVGTHRPLADVRPILEQTLGFIHFKRDRTGLHIRLRPEMVTQRALAGLLYQVFDFEHLTVLMSAYSGKSWQHEILRGRRSVLDRINAMIEDHERTIGAEARRFISKPIGSDASAFTLSQAAVRAVLLHMPDIEAMSPVLDALFAQRYTIAEKLNDNGPIIIRKMGEGYRAFDPSWFDSVVGRSMDEYADQAYGRWVADTYEAAIRDGQPAYHDVDAFIHWPGTKAVRSRYKRLVVPMIRSNGQRLLAAATMSDASIDLRREALNS